jgi:hypothetical protein
MLLREKVFKMMRKNNGNKIDYSLVDKQKAENKLIYPEI